MFYNKTCVLFDHGISSQTTPINDITNTNNDFFFENDDEIRALMNRDLSYEDVHLSMEVENIYVLSILIQLYIYIYMCVCVFQDDHEDAVYYLIGVLQNTDEQTVLFDKNDLFEHDTTSQTKPFNDITITDTDTNLDMIDFTEFSTLIQSSLHLYTYLNYMCMFLLYLIIYITITYFINIIIYCISIMQ